MHAIADALRPEAVGRKSRTLISERAKDLVLTFEARDSTVLRAVVSSYLRMLRAALNASNALIIEERGTQVKNQ